MSNTVNAQQTVINIQQVVVHQHWEHHHVIIMGQNPAHMDADSCLKWLKKISTAVKILLDCYEVYQIIRNIFF